MPRFRRGFALPLVILLLLISSMTIVVIMQRQTAQTRLVHEMIDDYQTHHAAFGVRAIVRKWISNKTGSDLSEFAAKEGVSYRFVLPNDVYVSVWVLDGQGIPVTTPTDIGPANVRYYTEITSRIRSTSDRALRARGPSMISIATAPRDVLEALVEDEDQGRNLADRIIKARERRPLDRDGMMNQLRRAGLGDDQIARIVAITTFDPGLWRVNVMSESPKSDTQRYFIMHAEITLGSLSIISWEEITPTDPSDPFAEKPTKTNDDDSENADLDDNKKPGDAPGDNADDNADRDSRKNTSTR